MKEFARLFARLDETNRTSEKIDAMTSYFRSADPADAAWAVDFLSGNRPKRLIPVRRLATWAMEVAQVPEWLFDECYDAVGDLAESIALLLPGGGVCETLPLHRWVEERLLPLAGVPEDAQRDLLLASWRELTGNERFVWNKLITGSFRVGVSRQLVVRALAAATGIDAAIIAHRLSGHWKRGPQAYLDLVAADGPQADASRPYPFYLAYPLESELELLGAAGEWTAEWKWDGIRAQVIRRGGATHIWSRGDELVTERFPELARAADGLPEGTVLDGEIMPWRSGAALPFAQLQRRIGRKTLTAKILSEVPVVLIAYDLLERDGRDTRTLPFVERRERLAAVLASDPDAPFILSPTVHATEWGEVRAAWGRARELGAEGLMLKQRDGAYGVGRKKGGWWKWKVAPYSVDAVMIYAQAGHGRRASLHTDYTFAVWDNGALVPFAKAYSGLTDSEIRALDGWIRRNTLEKFGPVRQVKAEHVFELGFEGIQVSTRHKSGVAVRFPRILRWRTDKGPESADTLDTLRALMAHHG